MKSSFLLAATGAVVAFANPLEKRVWETEVVVEYYTVIVTGNPPPAPTPTKAEVHPNPNPVYEYPHEYPHEQPETTKAVVTTVSDELPETTKAVVTTVPDELPKPTKSVVIVTVTPEPEPEPKPTTHIKVPDHTPSPVNDTPAQPENTAPAGNSMEAVALYHHNIHRSNHSSPEMSWNGEIAGYAANTAATCKFAHDMDQGRGGYGQNIALWGVSSGAEKLGAAGAVKMATTNMWYDGEFNSFLPSYYGKDTPDMGNFEAWGHLSQLVWASSTGLGCAVQFCPRGTAYDNLDAWFTVCNYSPPGNVGGAYGRNINRPKGDATVTV